LDSKLATIGKHEKETPQRKVKTRPQDRMNNNRSSLNNNNGHILVPRPSTTCMAVTNYHNNPTNFISSW
jgi:hypothetical protein